MILEPKVHWSRWLTNPFETRLALKEWRWHYDYFRYLEEGLSDGTIHVWGEFYIERFELDMNQYLIPQNMSKAKRYIKFKILRFTEDEEQTSFLCTGVKGLFLISEDLLWKLFISNGSLKEV